MNIKKITFSSQLNNPYKRSYVAQTMKTAPSKSAVQNSPIDDKDNENSNDFSENRKNRILMYIWIRSVTGRSGIWNIFLLRSTGQVMKCCSAFRGLG